MSNEISLPKLETSPLRYYLKTLSLPILGVLVGTLAYVLIYDFVLCDIEEPLPGLFQLGKLFYAVCLSYITAFVFYFVVVYVPRVKAEKSTFFLSVGTLLAMARTAELHAQEMREMFDLTGTGKYLNAEETERIVGVAFADGEELVVERKMLLSKISGTIRTIARFAETLFALPRFHDLFSEPSIPVYVLKGMQDSSGTTTNPMLKSSTLFEYTCAMHLVAHLDKGLDDYRGTVKSFMMDDMLKSFILFGGKP